MSEEDRSQLWSSSYILNSLIEGVCKDKDEDFVSQFCRKPYLK